MKCKINWIIINGVESLPPADERVLIMSEEGDISVEKRSKNQNFIYSDTTDSGCAIAWAEIPDLKELYKLCFNKKEEENE